MGTSGTLKISEIVKVSVFCTKSKFGFGESVPLELATVQPVPACDDQ